MRYLITGGAGFIGSHLAETLLRQGHEVVIIDDLCTGSIHNIENLKRKRGFSYIIDSMFNRPLLAELIDDCDAVFHLAASVGVKLIVESPVHTIETNVKGTEGVLEFANKKRKKVLVASTSEVYGKSTKIPFSENDDLVMGPTFKGRWSYACSKAIDEFLALAYWKEKGLPVVIVRLFNTVGPRQTGRYGMVLPSFVRAALAGQPLTVFGDGKQSRCFCHVSDTVGALSRLIEHPDAVGQIFNIGSNEEISIEQLARMVKSLAGSASPIHYIPYEEAYEEGFEDMQRRVPDIGKIHNLLNFQTTYNTRQIIQSVIDSFGAPVKPRRAGNIGKIPKVSELQL
jgi:nucleoside-diphosphate-sugar epimerase